MNTKHTEGPWHVTGKGLSRYVEGRVRPGVLQEVAWCGATEVPEQMEANARLIAAAPEMLEALDNIGGLSRALRVGGPDPMDLHELSDALQEAVDTANAIVAKATGASHVSQQSNTPA
ncbi:hypothetical protein KMC49_gp46 [Ralstonia phage Firinga]|uniref:Uncharacterized protein n=3 Tax=Firingavirus TaxID=2843381 RepID=A0A7G5B9Z1_9CAUD|nr:hypothetical protein X532_gp42 [Ralstonia phage RSK1]YP_010078585.1 hypothetical protein KMC49_gp46 [Ralstonia phage Firinga]QMV33114.1 hypothetical protein 18C_00046 [Ralstonia phage Firinga]QMV33343.1 hypothetical protein 12C_00033 [Ralstonia phage Hennie]BAO04707.1 hypothetical protein [Ralstonia phage RSK1]